MSAVVVTFLIVIVPGDIESIQVQVMTGGLGSYIIIIIKKRRQCKAGRV